MKLYEIEATYQQFMELVENGEIPDDAIADTLESITAALEEKADNIACVIKNLVAEAAAIQEEEKKLKKRRTAKENRADFLKFYLSNALQRSGKTELETARNKITFLKSEGLQVEDEKAFIEWAKVENPDFLTYKEPTIDKNAVKKAIQDGAEIKGAQIEQRSNIQIK